MTIARLETGEAQAGTGRRRGAGPGGAQFGEGRDMGVNVRQRDGGAAAWSGSVAAPWMLVVGGALGVTFLVSASLFSEELPGLLGVLAGGVAFVAMGSIRVSVTGREVTVRSVLIPVLRRRIPLSRVRRAFAKRARPIQLGGWGYRWMPRRTGVSLRAGDALWLQLNSGREFVITVDDAARAADAVNERLAAAGR